MFDRSISGPEATPRLSREEASPNRIRLLRLLEQRVPEEGSCPASWPGLLYYRSHRPTTPSGVRYKPSLCIVAQGSKEVTVGELLLHYDPWHYLVLALPLPVRSRILEASPERPFLSLVLELDRSTIAELLLEMGNEAKGPVALAPRPAIEAPPLDPALFDALLRFLSSIDDPTDRRILAPIYHRELLYRLLCGEQGALVAAVALQDRDSQRTAQVIRYLETHYRQDLDIPTIAREAGMSVSALHHTFKAVTSLSPIQFLKQVRLH